MNRLLLWLFLLPIVFPLIGLENPFTYLQQQKAIRQYKKGNFEEAEILWQKLLFSNPENAELLYNLGNATYAQKKYDKADYYFGKAASFKASCQLEAFFNQGNARVKKDALEKALESYESVLQLNKEHKEAREMIDTIKKILEERKKQDQENKSEQEKQEKEKKSESDSSQKDKNKKEKNDSSQGKSENSKKEKEENQSNKSDDQREDSSKKEDKTQNKENSVDGGESQDVNPSSQSEKKDRQEGAQQKGAINKKEEKLEKDLKSSEYNAQELALFKALDEHETKSIRQRLKVDLQKGMQEQHGHKNW